MMESKNKPLVLKKKQEDFNEHLIKNVTRDFKKIEIESEKYHLSKKTAEDVFFREYLKIKNFNQGNQNFDVIYKHLDKFIQKNEGELRFKSPDEMQAYLLEIEKIRKNEIKSKKDKTSVSSPETSQDKKDTLTKVIEKMPAKAPALDSAKIEEITRNHEAIKQITSEVKGDHLSFYFIGLLIFIMLFIGLVWILFSKKR